MNRSRSRINPFVVGKNAERERNRVRCLRAAFQTLQDRLPTVPPNTKLSKLDILILATNYINQLTKILEGASVQESALNQHLQNKFFHPIKKWPMRKRLYSRIKNDDEEEEADESVEENYWPREDNADNEDSSPPPTDEFEQQMDELSTDFDYTSDQKSFTTLQEFQGHIQIEDYTPSPEKYDSQLDLLWFPTFESSL